MAMLLQVACQRVPATHTTLTRAPLHGCRGGLSARPRQDHLQIHIDPCSRFDYDDQLAALRGDVAKIKQVRFVLAAAAPEGGGGGVAMHAPLPCRRLRCSHAGCRVGCVHAARIRNR
jgi:hypothetical protein